MSTLHLVDLLNAPWAIVPEKLLELQAIYARHLHGEGVDLAAIEARLGRPLASDQQAYAMRPGGVAVLEISGVIAPKANMFTRISGGASANMLQAQVNSMRDDPRVVSALLDWDTPGGNVLGIPGLADSIARLAAEKPTVSISTGIMASAGYWAGSAANAVYISGLTDVLGSIGVVQAHTFDPRKAALQVTEVTAGKYKRIASDNAPLSAEGQAYIQAQVDEVYSVMVQTVARQRQASVEDVLARMADGRIFIGQQALDAGLADGVSSVDDLAELMATDPKQFAARTRAVFAVTSPGTKPRKAPAAVVAIVSPTHSTQGVTMTPQEQAASFVAEHPEAAALIRAEASTAERQRIQAVRGVALAGHQALVDQLAFDGHTTAAEAAIAVLNAERALASGRAAAIAADAPAALPADASAAAADPPAAAPAQADPLTQAHELRDLIAAKQKASAALGRTLNPVQAMAAVLKEQANG